jgi:hypothetical protein
VRPDDGKIVAFCAEWATPMSDDPPICKSNGFALQRKPNGGRITLNAASIRGISVKRRFRNLYSNPRAHMPQAVMADDHVAAKVGSVENDPYGRLLQRTSTSFALSGIWLQVALERAIETHDEMPEHFVSWANRLDLFDDLTFLIEGVRAWYERDLVKAVHVLVPQIERGLRGIVAKLGKPVTKAHSTVAGVGVAIGMGDILYSEELSLALGPDLSLVFSRALCRLAQDELVQPHGARAH